MTDAAPVDPMDEEMKKMRELDMNIALSIAGFAGMDTRDRHGNIVSEIWTKCNDTDTAAAKLLDYGDMRYMLKTQLNNHLEARKELLLETDSHEVVAQWIFNFAESWESEYRKRSSHGWDISQRIMTCMEEALYEVNDILNEIYPIEIRPGALYDRIERIIATNTDAENSSRIYTDAHTAYIRLWFRNKHTGPMIAHIAGKKLQKQIVCNRSGAYSAKVQRNDIQQEVDAAVDVLYNAVMSEDSRFDKFHKLVTEMSSDKHQLQWILDHTTKPFTLPDSTPKLPQ
tara:strand:+ start:5487 stop:6341 length:855 start_codon:yes stop_codon:yes gene_type:complete